MHAHQHGLRERFVDQLAQTVNQTVQGIGVAAFGAPHGCNQIVVPQYGGRSAHQCGQYAPLKRAEHATDMFT